eukprot:NODE_2596_length_669_cov_105.651613_g2133_i0.p1 GENE.NODE_2596_length_669_cov_105.651613_g2133_i0~~NODE_2596_length_669_cov_105.651613_g2133_i0.p1  ORF type:complete len:215 (-),score=44.91 NODE_2596_length_669_cov_105.651613_g2133_i0:25-612(-)
MSGFYLPWMIAMLMLPSLLGNGVWSGCHDWTSWASAGSTMHFSGQVQGTFNISTSDYLKQKSCQGTADLQWGHWGSFLCLNRVDPNTTGVRFDRQAVWMLAHTEAAVLAAKFLCPHVALKVSVTQFIPLNAITTLCSGISFNNCASFYDAVRQTGVNGTVLARSKAPSCLEPLRSFRVGVVAKCTTGCKELCTAP